MAHQYIAVAMLKAIALGPVRIPSRYDVPSPALFDFGDVELEKVV